MSRLASTRTRTVVGREFRGHGHGDLVAGKPQERTRLRSRLDGIHHEKPVDPLKSRQQVESEGPAIQDGHLGGEAEALLKRLNHPYPDAVIAKSVGVAADVPAAVAAGAEMSPIDETRTAVLTFMALPSMRDFPLYVGETNRPARSTPTPTTPWLIY